MNTIRTPHHAILKVHYLSLEIISSRLVINYALVDFLALAIMGRFCQECLRFTLVLCSLLCEDNDCYFSKIDLLVK